MSLAQSISEIASVLDCFDQMVQQGLQDGNVFGLIKDHKCVLVSKFQ